MKDIIIHHPEWVVPKQKLLIGMATLFAWLVWIYLWIPFISLMAWIFGIQLFNYQMIELGGYQALVELLGWYSLVILLLGGGLVLWATYNIRRFKGTSRRLGHPLVTAEMEARHFSVDAKELAMWRQSRRIVIENNQIRALNTDTLPAEA
jgi:biofilm PGA synthesis protein PgaD